MQDICGIFNGVDDPRRGHATRHDLQEMPVIAFPCFLSGGRNRADMERYGRMREGFLRKFMAPGHGIPSHDAFPDPVDALDPDGPRGALTRLPAGWGARPGTVAAIDGRALRGPFRDAAERSPLHLARAFAAERGPPPARVRVDGRPDGTTALPALPDPRGRTVTADAVRARRAAAGPVTARGGSHVLAPRGSRETPRDGARIHMADPENAERMPFSRDVDRDHGRIGTREAAVRHDAGVLRDLHHRPRPQAVGKLTATGEIRGKAARGPAVSRWAGGSARSGSPGRRARAGRWGIRRIGCPT